MKIQRIKHFPVEGQDIQTSRQTIRFALMQDEGMYWIEKFVRCNCSNQGHCLQNRMTYYKISITEDDFDQMEAARNFVINGSPPEIATIAIEGST